MSSPSFAGLLRRQRSRSQQNARAAYHPPQALHFIDTAEGRRLVDRPYIHPYVLTRDPRRWPRSTSRSKRKVYRAVRQGLRRYICGACSRSTNPPVRVRSQTRQPLFFFGADRLGRGVFSRIMVGTRRSRCRSGWSACSWRLVHRHRAGRHLGLLRRPDRLRDPARHRVGAVAADDSDLAGRPPRCRRTGRPTLNYFMITLILSLTGWAQLARVVRGRFLSLGPRISSPPRGSTAARRGASSSATCCRASPATSSRRSRWPFPP